MVRLLAKLFDTGAVPKPTQLSAYWHTPQFSKLFDTKTGRDCIAMLIAVPEQLFDGDAAEGPDPVEVGLLAREINRIVSSKWTSDEAEKTSKWFTDRNPNAFVAILEHAATGAYATRTQQVKAYYAFENGVIGKAEPLGQIYENETVFQSITL